IISMTSAENWACTALPAIAGVNVPCQLSGTDLAAAGGQSLINVVVQFPDAGNASETQNCVAAVGLDANGNTVATTAQVCAQFNGPGIVVCDPGTVRAGATCVAVAKPKLPEFILSVTQPKPCTPGKSCTFKVDFDGDGAEIYAGPVFVSASLRAAVGVNG